ncbi:mitochondrial basic amino acids transporter isoform X1 [Lasioglossum baleicum]|uniref:mitochondrial basic amino acids transporter isoform X1 n=1 Tax=Lasioglossum baleicum TaxID=434251 RepID=UPI003FCE4160
MALDFIAGCLGGSAGIVVGYPLDTVKVHMQTQDYRNPKYKGSWHCFRTIIAKESVAGLYRGMTSPMTGVAMVNAITFGVYGLTQKHMTNSDSLASHFIAGTIAGIAQSPICSPIELAKTRIQLQTSSGKFSGPLQYLKHTYKYDGYRGVFKGFNVTVLREAPSFGVYFLTYEAITRSSGNEPVSTPCMLLAGGIAGTASWVLTYPLDVIKSRIQADNNRYTGVVNCFKQSVKTEGYSCLYRGVSSTILRAFPTNAITFTVVTWIFRICGQETHETSQTKKLETVQSVRKMSGVYEPFLEKWNSFSIDDSYSITVPRFRYSTLSMMCVGNSVFQQTVAFSRGSETGGKLNAVQHIRDDKCTEVTETLKERGDVDEGCDEKKVELLDVDRSIGQCIIDTSGLLNCS